MRRMMPRHNEVKVRDKEKQIEFHKCDDSRATDFRQCSAHCDVHVRNIHGFRSPRSPTVTAHSFNYSNPLTPFPLRFRSMSKRRERGGETPSCRFPKCDKSNFSHGKHNALPLFETDERRGGDEFIQSSGDSFTLASPRWRPSLSLSRQSAGRHNNVKLGALFPRKYPTDGWTNRQPFYVNEKTENDATAVASPRLPASLPPLIIPTFSLL